MGMAHGTANAAFVTALSVGVELRAITVRGLPTALAALNALLIVERGH